MLSFLIKLVYNRYYNGKLKFRKGARMLQEIVVAVDKQKDILYLTDDAGLLKSLIKEGKKAAAILNEKNAQEDFGGAPYAVEAWEELTQRDFERIYRRLAHLPWEITKTRRCKIREMTPQDAEALCALYQDAQIKRYMRDGFADVARQRQYIEDYCRFTYAFYECGIWLIEEKDTGRIIGKAGLEICELGAELGYALDADFRGRGYAYEACSAVLAYAKEEGLCERVFARIEKENQPSRSLLERLGFYRVETDLENIEQYEKILIPPEAALQHADHGVCSGQ